MASETVVRCGRCSTALAESQDVAPKNRTPCPQCGSTTRTFDLTGTLVAGVGVSADVVAMTSAATAQASAATPKVVVETLEDAGFDVQWLRLSQGGAWLVRVFDRQGDLIDVAEADDPQEAILTVSERLLPPSEIGPTET